ncbi:MAG: PKD domain-containing protein [Candidatus Binataceae bacterium]
MQPLPAPGMESNAPGTSINRMTEGDVMGLGQHMRIMQPVIASLAASPPYGNAPLTVGFFVTASDPEDIGFLTYQWNFGDGAVSSLPPELYIFHVYQQPGNYVVSLIMKTVDGRSISLFTPVIVHAPAD